MTTSNAIKAAKAIVKKDTSISKKKLEAFLTIEDYSPADIKAAIKEVLGDTIKPKTFATEYYEYLGAKLRTKEEVEAYILGNGEYGETSANVQKHKSHYINIWELTAKVWGAK